MENAQLLAVVHHSLTKDPFQRIILAFATVSFWLWAIHKQFSKKMNNIDKEVPIKIIWQWLIPNNKNKILRSFIYLIYSYLRVGSNCVIDCNLIMYIPYSVSKNNLLYSLLVDCRINIFCNLGTCDCVFHFFIIIFFFDLVMTI